MSSYIVEQIKIIGTPTAIIIKNVVNPLYIKSCFIYNVQKGSGDSGIIEFNSIKNDIHFSDTIIQNCCVEDNQQKLISISCTAGYKLKFFRSEISNCPNNKQTLQHKVLSILSDFEIEDVNFTRNCAIFDSIMSINANSDVQSNFINRIKAVECYSSLQICLYIESKKTTLTNIELVRNNVGPTSPGIFYQRNGASEIYDSNIISESEILLFCCASGTIKVYNSFTTHAGTKTGPGCEIISTIESPLQIGIDKPVLNLCFNSQSKANTANLTLLVFSVFQFLINNY